MNAIKGQPMTQRLDYANPNLGPHGGVRLVLAFCLATLTAGTAANLAWWLGMGRPDDDSLQILFALLGMLLGAAVVAAGSTMVILVRRGRRAAPGAAWFAALAGTIYGLSPAAGFLISQYVAAFDRIEPLLPLLALAAPVAVPLWLLKSPAAAVRQ